MLSVLAIQKGGDVAPQACLSGSRRRHQDAGSYDNIPHNGRLKMVNRRIADEKVWSLISAFLKAGYMENWHYHQTYSGTPQGGIISPLLCNIFLHQLDEYMVALGANEVQTKQEANLR